MIQRSIVPSVHHTPNCGTNRQYTFRPMVSKSFKFQVKANNDVNLCLSPTDSEIPHQQYEIFLGGWRGKESAIRKNKQDDVCKVKTPDVLSKNQFRGFWVVVSHHAIKVGNEGQEIPFLTHSDPDVRMNVFYYGYCTAYGSTGQWIFGDEHLEPRIDTGPIGLYNSLNCGTKRQYVFRPMKGKTFKFQVKAIHDVNLCLSSADFEIPHQQYEIFLGAWAGGGESGIRKNKLDDVCKVKTPYILSKNQFRGFWVVVSPHSIKVGKEGQETPFLIHSDPSEKMNLSHYGYCTAYGSTGQWKFGDDDLRPEINMDSIDDDLEPEIAVPVDMDSIGAVFNPLVPWISPRAPPPPYSPPSQPMDNGSLKWVSCKSASMCFAPVPAGPGENGPYVAAAYHQGGLMPAVVMPPKFNVCSVPWGFQAFQKKDFFVLSNPGNVELVWQESKCGKVPVGALQGGYSEHGAPLYIGRFQINGNYISGKIHQCYGLCYVPYLDKEVSNSSYEVLCLKTVPLSYLGI